MANSPVDNRDQKHNGQISLNLKQMKSKNQNPRLKVCALNRPLRMVAGRQTV